jgi:hypothetical protein
MRLSPCDADAPSRMHSRSRVSIEIQIPLRHPFAVRAKQLRQHDAFASVAVRKDFELGEKLALTASCDLPYPPHPHDESNWLLKEASRRGA